MGRTIAMGVQDFSKIREKNLFYVDKTNFIKEWWENYSPATLINRPRKFGKTLIMSMIEQFFSVQYAGRGDSFEGLDIWKEEKYRELQGTYPVVSLSFAEVKGESFEDVREQICQLIAEKYSEYEFLIKSGFLEGEESEFLKEFQ